MNKKIVLGLCLVAVISGGVIFALAKSTNEYMDIEAFVNNSNKEIACETKIKEDSEKETLLSYDGVQYTAKRSDGTTGTGKKLLILKGSLPKATGKTTYIVISDKEYSFEEISNDILGITTGQLDYFLVH